MFSENNVFLIAEVGGNHEGSYEGAVRLVTLACDSGADAVKLQVYKPEALVSRLESPNRHAHFKRFSLTTAEYLELARLTVAKRRRP